MAGKIYLPPTRRYLTSATCLSFFALMATTAGASEEAAPRAADLGEGRLIRVRLPLVGNADEHIKSSIQRALDQLTKPPRHQVRRPILVLEITPARRQGGNGEGTDFERALSL